MGERTPDLGETTVNGEVLQGNTISLQEDIINGPFNLEVHKTEHVNI